MEHPKQILSRLGIEPKKSLGQNFLFDPNVLQPIIEAANVQPSDHILEIGPGLGHLTAQLLATGASVTAVELDSRFIPHLQTTFADYANFTLVHNDILEVSPNDLFDQPYKVVANVPYYITGAILRHLLSANIKPTTVVITIQKEVAERLTAVPPNMSLLSATTQFYAMPHFVSTLKAGAFWPRPDVDSAIVRLDLHQERPLPFDHERKFMQLLKAGFSQKRKQLKNNLKQLGIKGKEVTAVLQTAQVDPTRRPQTLSIEEWVRVYDVLYLGRK